MLIRGILGAALAGLLCLGATANAFAASTSPAIMCPMGKVSPAGSLCDYGTSPNASK